MRKNRILIMVLAVAAGLLCLSAGNGAKAAAEVLPGSVVTLDIHEEGSVVDAEDDAWVVVETRDDALMLVRYGQESAVWTCPGCSRENDGDSAFCPWCGEKKPADTVTCPECGAEYEAGAGYLFCRKCGAKLAGSEPESTPKPTAAPTAEPAQAIQGTWVLTDITGTYIEAIDPLKTSLETGYVMKYTFAKGRVTAYARMGNNETVAYGDYRLPGKGIINIKQDGWEFGQDFRFTLSGDTLTLTLDDSVYGYYTMIFAREE